MASGTLDLQRIPAQGHLQLWGLLGLPSRVRGLLTTGRMFMAQLAPLTGLEPHVPVFPDSHQGCVSWRTV